MIADEKTTPTRYEQACRAEALAWNHARAAVDTVLSILGRISRGELGADALILPVVEAHGDVHAAVAATSARYVVRAGGETKQ